jgi:hypothetical protein
MGLFGLGAVSSAGLLAACGADATAPKSKASATSDQDIINAAEALASVMYDNIIKSSPAYAALNSNLNDQAYLVAGREQEAIHYATLVGAGAVPLAQTFYFPATMFTDTTFVTTVNTLITLEDAFIAAYLIGIRDLSTDSLKELAGQIMGVEAEHRAFARVIASDLGLTSTTGLSGVAESVVAPMHAANNLAFERTFSSSFRTIADVVTALGPFVTPPASGSSFGTTAYAFNTTAGYYTSETPTVTLDETTP